MLIDEPLQSRNSKEITDALLRLVVVTQTPKLIICNADLAYVSRVFEIVCSLMGIQLEFTPSFAHHFSFAEVAIHLISQRLLSLIEKNADHDWLAEVKFAVYGVNMTPNKDTKYTPFELYYGRKNNYSTDLTTLKVKPVENTSSTYKEYIEQIRNKINEMREDIIQKRQLQRTIEAQRQRNKITKVQNLIEGTFCYVWCPTYKTALASNSRKFNFHYVGPLLLTRKHPDNFVTLCSLDGQVITQPVHVRRIHIAKIRLGQHYARTIHDLVEILQSMPHDKQIFFQEQLESLKKLTNICKEALASVTESGNTSGEENSSET